MSRDLRPYTGNDEEEARLQHVALTAMIRAGTSWIDVIDQLGRGVVEKATELTGSPVYSYGVVVMAIRHVMHFPITFRQWVKYEHNHKDDDEEEASDG